MPGSGCAGREPEAQHRGEHGAVVRRVGGDLARASGLEKHGELMAWLKTEHGLSHGNANLVALSARRGSDAPTGDALVDSNYAGQKAAVRPLHDAVIAVAKGFGSDVELAPKQAYVSLRRSKQFRDRGAGVRWPVGSGPRPEGRGASGSSRGLQRRCARIASVWRRPPSSTARCRHGSARRTTAPDMRLGRRLASAGPPGQGRRPRISSMMDSDVDWTPKIVSPTAYSHRSPTGLESGLSSRMRSLPARLAFADPRLAP